MTNRFGYLVAATLALLAAPVSAQYGTTSREDPAPPPFVLGPSPYTTELEARLEARDRLLVEQRRVLPSIALESGSRLTLEAVLVSEYGREQERAMGVRATVASGEGERGAYLDVHEVEDLLRALQSIPVLVESARKNAETETEIRHVTRDGFGVVVRTSGKELRRMIRLGSGPVVYFRISKQSAEELARQLDACRQFLLSS